MVAEMTRTRGIVLTVAVFIAGLACGGVAVAWILSEFLLASSLASSAAAAAFGNTVALEAIRAGDTAKASSTLESFLDSNLITLNALPASQKDESIQKILRRTAQYRAQNPRKSSEPVVDSAVSELLSKYPPKKNREK
jgi:predicted phosphoribosyltransferase